MPPSVRGCWRVSCGSARWFTSFFAVQLARAKASRSGEAHNRRSRARIRNGIGATWVMQITAGVSGFIHLRIYLCQARAARIRLSIISATCKTRDQWVQSLVSLWLSPIYVRRRVLYSFGSWLDCQLMRVVQFREEIVWIIYVADSERSFSNCIRL